MKQYYPLMTMILVVVSLIGLTWFEVASGKPAADQIPPVSTSAASTITGNQSMKRPLRPLALYQIFQFLARCLFPLTIYRLLRRLYLNQCNRRPYGSNQLYSTQI